MFNQMQVNRSDTLADLIIKVEGMNGVYPVLFGRADGAFQWNNSDQKGSAQ